MGPNGHAPKARDANADAQITFGVQNITQTGLQSGQERRPKVAPQAHRAKAPIPGPKWTPETKTHTSG